MTRSLAVDLGGTHIRFRLVEDSARIGPVHVVETSGAGSFEDAVGQWRDMAAMRERLDAIGVAAAGPVTGDRARITNTGWDLDAGAIARACNARRCLFVNDVAAIAWALPSLDGGDVRLLNTIGPEHGVAGGTGRCGADARGAGRPDVRAARAVIAPGTGLGVSGLVPTQTGDFAAIEGEGGHRTLSAQGPREWAIVSILAERFGHPSAERALSGPGIEAIWRALVSLDGARRDGARIASEIARDAFDRSDPIAEEAITTFTGLLGSVAGDLALTLGARGGVYIAGGIVPEWGERFDAARFLDRFRAKGRFREYLSAIPVRVVTHPYPGLAGVERLLAYRSDSGS